MPTKYLDIRKIQNKKKSYKSFPHATLPVPHNNDIPVPRVVDMNSQVSSESFDIDAGQSSYQPSEISTNNNVELVSQGKFNDLVRDLNLSKTKSELLGSRLK